MTSISSKTALRAEIADLQTRLAEAEETLRAIRGGEVDGLVMAGQVLTRQCADTPYCLLNPKRDPLEARVAERTVELASANAFLVETQSISRKLIEDTNSARAALEQANVKLGASEERFRIMAEAIGAVIWLMDASSGIFLYVSSAFENVYGLPCSALYANPRLWMENIDPEDRERVASANSSFKKGLLYDVEYRIRRPDGCVRWMRNRGYPVRDPEGKVVMISGVADDISERRALEDALATAKDAAEAANRAKSMFLANMSHEIRTPLNAIVGLGHLLRRDLTDHAQRNRVDQLAANSNHLLAIINDILDLSKIEAMRLMLEKTDFTLDQVIRKSIRLVEGTAQEKELLLTTEVLPYVREMAVHGDILRLSQVLINLCTNAIKFTDSGAVTVRIELLAEAEESVTLRFAVNDTGIGIATADQARLFEPFEQVANSTPLSRSGTGLGLSISQGLVALMGGTIDVKSSVGAGSTFSFVLVLPHATGIVSEPDVPLSDALTHRFPGANVLIAEDHPLNQEILLEMLEDLSCECDIAADGIEAVACAQVRRYDLILMDMRMPNMDGITATRQIRALSGYSETPIIAQTANAFAEDRLRCLDAGMSSHIAKPTTPAALAAMLMKWLPNLAVARGKTQTCTAAPALAFDALPGLDAACPLHRSAKRQRGSASLLQRYVELHEHDMKHLLEHLADGDRNAARSVVHKLIGVSEIIGAKSIAQLASEIEGKLRADADANAIASITAICATKLASLAVAVRALPPEGSSECIKCPESFQQVALCFGAAERRKVKGLN